MAAIRYHGRHDRSGRRGISITECALALSVIVGLSFVTLRILGAASQPLSIQSADRGTVMLETETTPPATGGPETKTP
jgi:hypothetical protein